MALSSAGSGGAGRFAAKSSGRLCAPSCGPSMQTRCLMLGTRAAAARTGAAHIVRVDDDGRRVIGKIIIELVDKAHIDEGRDRADPPAGKQSERIVHTVVGEDGDAIALADAELVQCAGVAFHRRHSIGKTERHIAIDPAQRDFIRSASGTITQHLMHQHACRSLLGIIQEKSGFASSCQSSE